MNRFILKRICIFLLLAFILSIFPAGCSGSRQGADTGTTLAEGTGQDASETQGETVEERIKLKMFMCNSGLDYPDGVDPSSNEYIGIVEDYANVDLELEVPVYQDFKTKYELMMASGSLPDIVHTIYREDAERAGDQGAFIDLKQYYDASTVLKDTVTAEHMELAKSGSGHYYRIPMVAMISVGEGIITRYDLLEKYNGGKFPASVNEWIEFMRAVKKAEPNSTPLASRLVGNNVFRGFNDPIFVWYGARPYNFRMEGGKFISTFTVPEYKAAVAVMNQMYKEGILDKEFVTSDTNKWLDALYNNNLCLISNATDQVKANVQNAQTRSGAENNVYVMAPALTAYPEEVRDTKYVNGYVNAGINSSHGLYISKNCKTPERAFKVIEGFSAEKLYDAIFWGREGIEYTVKGGEREIDPVKLADPSRSWVLQLGIIFGFTAGSEAKDAMYKKVWGEEKFNVVDRSIAPVVESSKERGVSILGQLPDISGITEKLQESYDFISAATAKAVMGQTTMEEFDKSVAEYKTKYGFIDEGLTKYINEHKDELRARGCKEVDW